MIQGNQNLGSQNPTRIFTYSAKRNPFQEDRMELGELGLSKFFQGNKQAYLPRDSPEMMWKMRGSQHGDGGGRVTAKRGDE